MSLFRSLFSFLLFLVMVLASHKVFSAPDLSRSVPEPDSAKAQQALADLVTRLEAIQSVMGSFVQYTVDQKGIRLQESRGDFKAQRPGKFYWHTQAPLEQSIYSNGVSVTVYDPDLEQATVQALSDDIQSTPAVLFSGDLNEVGARFYVEARYWSDVSVQFLLRPKSPETLFEKMMIRFEGKQISELRLSDSLGQENTVSFIQTQINPELVSSDFEPQLPEGTDVIRDLPSGIN